MRHALALAVLLPAATPTGAATVKEKVPLAARPFPLTDVRLREGPFLQAMKRDQAYLLELDIDRLLHTYRLNAGLPSTAKPLGGWEAPDVELRGHTLGHFLSANALMYAATGDALFKTRAEQVVTEVAAIQQALGKRFNPGYLSAFPESFIDRVEKRERVWAPYYTLHKTMAGLLDVHQLCGNAQALDVLVRMTDWVKLRMDRLTEAQQQAMLETEFGGMNEVLANLYAVTGHAEHLRLARLFDHRAVFDPLARGEDALDRLHANTQIPKAIGAAREYELTGETRYRDIASFFWERVARHRSYVNGGHSDGEAFFPVDDFRRHLGTSSAETCNTYNMLKLTRHLFAWAPSAGLMDFYERGLVNHILASQDPATGGVTYYCPLKPGAFRTYSKPDASFWCCVGTGLENHAKYADTIYFRGDGSLFVNLFVASDLTWRENGLRVTQQTRFPEEDVVTLTIGADAPVRLGLKIRHPAWARDGMTADVNGTRAGASTAPSSYLTLDREWRDGDVVTVRLPMSLHVEELPGDPKTVALLWGPVVLAGDLGREGLTDAVRYGPSAPPVRRVAPVDVPVLVASEPGKLLAGIKPVAGRPLTFRTEGLGHPRDVTLVPFYQAHDVRYTVYWDLSSPAAWEKGRAEEAAAAKRRQELLGRAFDRADVNDAMSEADHAYRGEATGHWDYEGLKIRETRGGWFSYEMKVLPDRPMLVAFTYLGTEGRQRTFDVLVDGVKIATKTTEYHPRELLDLELPIPAELTRGKEKVTVRFETAPGATSAAIFEVRTSPAAER
jgi:DUF1680 family protein